MAILFLIPRKAAVEKVFSTLTDGDASYTLGLGINTCFQVIP